MAAQQGNKSPLTGNEITDPVLDHCHKTGSIRAVLNRWENAVLGRLENWANRIGNGVEPIAFLRACADYIEHHKANPNPIQYPTHKTEAEKKELRAKKAREARRKARLAAE
ncbi:endonuclease VII [Ralstonia phage RS-PII-1]|uniref:Endonuclease n=1 Tax=Ralstonia phage RS-PII-1 TaxID=1932892 RepID=A0A1L7DQG2_9CAUD|nr:endonuclease VII [Ralstonia phage RS-PII-1]APU00314.1 endonuclease [Ralstonia phage RS-PII-1]